MCELVWVVPLVLVYDCDSVSNEVVHAVMAGAGTHLSYSEWINRLFNGSTA